MSVDDQAEITFDQAEIGLFNGERYTMRSDPWHCYQGKDDHARYQNLGTEKRCLDGHQHTHFYWCWRCNELRATDNKYDRISEFVSTKQQPTPDCPECCDVMYGPYFRYSETTKCLKEELAAKQEKDDSYQILFFREKKMETGLTEVGIKQSLSKSIYDCTPPPPPFSLPVSASSSFATSVLSSSLTPLCKNSVPSLPLVLAAKSFNKRSRKYTGVFWDVLGPKKVKLSKIRQKTKRSGQPTIYPLTKRHRLQPKVDSRKAVSNVSPSIRALPAKPGTSGKRQQNCVIISTAPSNKKKKVLLAVT